MALRSTYLKWVKNMTDEEKKETEEEDYSLKEEIKEDGTIAVKETALGGINAAGRFGRKLIQALRLHPKVENVKKDVDESLEELKEHEAEMDD